MKVLTFAIVFDMEVCCHQQHGCIICVDPEVTTNRIESAKCWDDRSDLKQHFEDTKMFTVNSEHSSKISIKWFQNQQQQQKAVPACSLSNSVLWGMHFCFHIKQKVVPISVTVEARVRCPPGSLHRLFTWEVLLSPLASIQLGIAFSLAFNAVHLLVLLLWLSLLLYSWIFVLCFHDHTCSFHVKHQWLQHRWTSFCCQLPRPKWWMKTSALLRHVIFNSE